MAAINPNDMPMANDTRVVTSAIPIVLRAPYIKRDNISLPIWSVPSMWVLPKPRYAENWLSASPNGAKIGAKIIVHSISCSGQNHSPSLRENEINNIRITIRNQQASLVIAYKSLGKKWLGLSI